MPINLDVAPIGPFVTSGVGEHRSEKMLRTQGYFTSLRTKRTESTETSQLPADPGLGYRGTVGPTTSSDPQYFFSFSARVKSSFDKL